MSRAPEEKRASGIGGSTGNGAGRRFGRVLDAMMLAGAVILLIGLYYAVIKAGIPYQDPPLELQIRYADNAGIGRVLSRTGLCMLVIGGAVRALAGWIRKRKEKRRDVPHRKEERTEEESS